MASLRLRAVSGLATCSGRDGRTCDLEADRRCASPRPVTGDALLADLGLLDCLDTLESPSQQWLDDLLTDLPGPKSHDAAAPAPVPAPASQSWRSQGSCSQCGQGSSGPHAGSTCSCQHGAPLGKVPTPPPEPAPQLAAAAAARVVRLPKPPQLPTLLDACHAMHQPPPPHPGHPLQQRLSPFEGQPMQPHAPVAAAPALPPLRPVQRVPAAQQQLPTSTPRAGCAAGGLLATAVSQEALPASPAVAAHEQRMALLMRYFSLRRRQSQDQLLSTAGSGVYVPRGQQAQQQHAQQQAQQQVRQVEVLQTSASAPASYTVLLRAEGSGVYVQGSMPIALPQRAPSQAACAGQPGTAAALQPRTSLKRSHEQALGQPQPPARAPPRPPPIQTQLPAGWVPVAAGAGPCPRNPAALLPPSPFSSQLPVTPSCVTPANLQHPACPTSPAKRSPAAFARRPSCETHATAGSQVGAQTALWLGGPAIG